MKKLGLLVLSLAVVGFSSTKAKANYENSMQQELIVEETMIEKQKENNNEVFSKPERNKDCIDNIENIKIFQTFDKHHALAFYNNTEDKYSTQVALIDDFVGDFILYDGFRIEVPKNKCIVIRDTFTYESNNKMQNTVPVITFEYEYKPMNKKEAAEKNEKIKNKINNVMCNNANKIKKQGFKNVEQCQCYIDTMLSLEFLTEIDLSNKTNPKIDGFVKGFKNAEQQCGKLLTATNKPNKSKKVVNKK